MPFESPPDLLGRVFIPAHGKTTVVIFAGSPVNAQRIGNLLRCCTYRKGGLNMLLLIVLALLAIILFGVGFTIHWLFILAIIAALLFVISFFLGGAGGRSRRAWW
jgi:hypothetical protein